MSESSTVSTKQQRIAHLAGNAPDMAMDLSHHIDLNWMKEACRLTRKDGAAGVDGETYKEFAQGLDARLESLLDHAKGGTYRAPPVRRVQIPKGDGTFRPIGIPTFEDKVLQRATAMALEAVYEQDFLDCSYGFRPGRSPHDALQTLWTGLMKMGGGHVIHLDIQNFFDAVDHKTLKDFFGKRVRDGVLRRLLGKWLRAGVVESGQLNQVKSGVPQGGVISPLLSNIYLHEVLDKWFAEQVLPCMRSHAFMVRYADDAILVFANQRDAERVFEVLPKRFARFGLTLHPEKTQVIDFRRGAAHASFDLLGFTHLWARSRKKKLYVQRRTSRKRLSLGLRKMNKWLRNVRHYAISQQHRELCQKLRGHFQYYGLTGNGKSLSAFLFFTERLWRKWLGRRAYKARRTWEWFYGVLRRFPLPRPSPVHSVLRHVANP
jgi:RNA-directed DNA polymerase